MLRIIAGKFKSRILKTAPGTATRPTSDRLKETLFNLLQNAIEGTRFLDCFAGSGSIGIEALSRGAAFVVFVESSQQACRILRENLSKLGLEGNSCCRLLNKPVDAALKKLQQANLKFDMVFLDPPYAATNLYVQVLNQLQSCQLLEKGALVIAEHSKHVFLSHEEPGLTKLRELKQGDGALTLFRAADAKEIPLLKNSY